MSNCAEMISIAFACNLHKFDTSFHYKTFDWGLMSTPRSSLHAAERINLWWSVFVLERSISIALSVPGSIPLEASMVRLQFARDSSPPKSLFSSFRLLQHLSLFLGTNSLNVVLDLAPVVTCIHSARRPVPRLVASVSVIQSSPCMPRLSQHMRLQVK